MEPSSAASPWLTATNSSFYDVNTNTNGSFWANNGFRKRKAAATDLDEKINQKLFATEEKVIKDMRTLSLELNNNQSDSNFTENRVDEDLTVDDVRSDTVFIEDEILNEETTSPVVLQSDETSPFEFHPMLKENLSKENVHDALIRKLCENERKKLSMQLVPYVPIHPGQLTTESPTKHNEKAQESPKKNDDTESVTSNDSEDIQIDKTEHLFKRPFLPTAYTVEEPCEGDIKRASTMKRSFSQCAQYHGNLLVTELNNDSKDDLSIRSNPSSYFIVEPSTPSSMPSGSSSSFATNGLSLRISEYNDEPIFKLGSTNSNDFDDDIDMQSVGSSDTGDKMDDD